MQRRIALAISLALTVVTTFSVITVGAKAGVFGNGSTADAQPHAIEETSPGIAPDPTQPPVAAPPAAAPEPIVITEYVYVDESVAAPVPNVPVVSAGQFAAAAAVQETTSSPASDSVPASEVPAPTQAPLPTATTSAPPASHEDDDDHDQRDDDEHDDRHEDEHEEEDD